MITKKQIRLILVAIFWGAIYFLIKSQRFKTDKDPYIMGIILLTFIGHIWYEGIYKKNKIKKKKAEVKEKHLKELTSKESDFIPNIDKNDLPPELQSFIPLFKKWGIDNKILRDELYNKSEQEELFELKSIENKRELIESWTENNPEKHEIVKALKLTIQSYDDLGLWTWEK